MDRARSRGEEFQFVLDRFAVERLLYRLSQSVHRDEFVLKGAMLFALWFDQPHRPTRDADFLGFGPPDAERLAGTIRQLCTIDADDGLSYDTNSIVVTSIREEARYDGLRASLLARLGNARCTVQWDVGFGDAVTPAALQMPFPTLLDDMPAPELRVYPRETVFAEKLEAIAQLGIANSRMKDYFDLLTLVREGTIDPTELANAVRATFERRGTPIPVSPPFGLSRAFAQDAQKNAQWRAFLKRNRLMAPDLEVAVAEIRDYVTLLDTSPCRACPVPRTT
nr:nucleotidyl transferase AbiEii/AbiGii toxin family protein [Lysobacter sp. GX 14042]